MTGKQLTEYLELAKDAELAVYKQDTAIREATSALKKKDVVKATMTEPKIHMPVKPQGVKPFGPFGWFFLIAGSLLAILCFSQGSTGWGVYGIFCILLSVPSLYLSVKAKRSYDKAIIKYEQDVLNAKSDYEHNMEKYKNKLKTIDEDYLKKTHESEENFQKAKEQINLMYNPLQEAKNNLAKIYSKDCIFPKYRNMVAMCTIYEYFATGRVSELEGPNGAYNLYESELRQNMIINKLDTIVSQLEQIKENQYTIYVALKEQQKSLQSIKNNVSKICNNTSNIAACAAITAYCAEVISVNTSISARCDFLNTI